MEAVLNEDNLEPMFADFLLEDSIIASTRDSKSYFQNQVPASAVVNKNLSVSDSYVLFTVAVLRITAAGLMVVVLTGLSRMLQLRNIAQFWCPIST